MPGAANQYTMPRPASRITMTAAPAQPPPELVLRKGEERRVRAGHLWVFSNEVDTRRTPLTAFAPGDPVRVMSTAGKALGSGYVNPASLIAARIVSRDARVPFDGRLVRRRLERALRLRERLFPDPAYRLVYGEGDGLPGLIVDRYGDALVAQITTAGMERQREALVAALGELVRPASLLLRNDTPVRALEGLPACVEDVLGPSPATRTVTEGGLAFTVPLDGGQKTGWFYDQRDNRLALGAAWVDGRRVLDVFSYAGAWAVRAAALGARSVTCIEASASAAALVRENAARNGVADRIEVLEGDAFARLKALAEAGERYDTVILDPPAFIKRRKEYESGLQGYRRLHRAALRLLVDDAFLVSASCSGHLDRDGFRSLLRQSALSAGVDLQILRQGGLPPDHPVHPAIPETDYLKCLYCRVTRDHGSTPPQDDGDPAD